MGRFLLLVLVAFAAITVLKYWALFFLMALLVAKPLIS